MRRLAELGGELLEQRLDARGLGPAVEVAEGEPQILVAEDVDTAPGHVGQARAAQGRQRAMDGRLRAVQLAGELVESDAERMIGEFGEHGDHAVGADELLLAATGSPDVVARS